MNFHIKNKKKASKLFVFLQVFKQLTLSYLN